MVSPKRRRTEGPSSLCPVLAMMVLTVLVQPGVMIAQIPSQVTARHFPNHDELETMLRYEVEDRQIQGIVFGVLEADGSTHIVHYGEAGPGTRPLGPRSVFEIGSMTKSFTGTLLAYAVAEGEVALSDPISKYLPEGVGSPSLNGREITLLDLATHRSGLPKNPVNRVPADPANPYADYTVEKLYAFLSSYELPREPGSESEYSNAGMGLLGHLLGLAAGKDFKNLVRERILDPLGMTLTDYGRDGERGEWMTKGYDDDAEITSYYDVDVLAGAGGINANVEELLLYLKANVRAASGKAETPLEQAMHDAQQTQSPVRGSLSMGLGWQIVERAGRRFIMHGGGTGGFGAALVFEPEAGVGFVALCNSSRFDDDLGVELLRQGPPLDRPEVAVSGETLSAYVGEYTFSSGRSAFVALDGESRLTLRFGDDVRARLYAESQTSFFLKRRPLKVAFAMDSPDEPSLVVRIRGVEVQGQRATASLLSSDSR